MLAEHWKKHLRINPFFASLLLGHVSAYAMGPTYLWPVLIITLSLYWLTLTSFATEKPWKSYLSGFLFGFGFFVTSLWWIGNAVLVGGSEFKWVYPLAVCGLPIVFALYTMLAAGLTRHIARGRSLWSYLTFIVLLFLADVARGTLFTGFPWNLWGMAWTNNLAMLQILSVGGIYLLTFVTIIIAVTPAFVWKGAETKLTKGIAGILVLCLTLGVYTFGLSRLAHHPTEFHDDVVVQMIQPNIPQEDKWNADKRYDNLRITLDLLEPDKNWTNAKTRVIIMPETTLTYHDIQTPQVMDAMRGRLNGYTEETVYILTGALLRDDAGYHNSLIVLDKSAEFLESFDKFHLVPFGEYIPFQEYIPIPTVTNFSGFVEGIGPRTITHAHLPPFSPLVCYEVIFPGRVISETDPRPDWMVNVTNDAWYGISPGPFQHVAHAQYRAIEEGLPMVRVAQTGISVVIDAYGRVLAGSFLNEKNNVESPLPRPAAETLFSRIF
jgi:apolipoprotein N-acyltransferase